MLTKSSNIEAEKAELLGRLEALAEASGDPDLLRASRAVRQYSPGRPAIDDTLALEEVQWLVESGKAKTVNQALTRVAQSIAGYQNIRSVAERLRQKMKNTSGK
jgi:hypothetical protein